MLWVGVLGFIDECLIRVISQGGRTLGALLIDKIQKRQEVMI